MNNEKYQLRYLPIFFEDVKEIVLYIKNELSNEKEANDLIDAVENAIYVVIDDEGSDKIMEVRRMLYNRQDRENIV